MLARRFKAIVFDWDGCAVPDRRADTAPLVERVESLIRRGVWIVVVTGTNFENIDQQFTRRVVPDARAGIIICTNRGSEFYGFDGQGKPIFLERRHATQDEEQKLTAIADAVVGEVIARSGLEIKAVYDRLNRRKIDLIPLPEWADPPKAQIAQLLLAVERRLKKAGLAGGLNDAIEITQNATKRAGLPEARITSDGKNVEVGLTDKSDALRWLKANLFEPRRIALAEVLIAGDEFGPIDGISGSDERLRDGAGDAVVVSVGIEPNGVPAGVIHLPGGPEQFIRLLDNVVATLDGGICP